MSGFTFPTLAFFTQLSQSRIVYICSVFCHLIFSPDFLKSESKWPLESLTMSPVTATVSSFVAIMSCRSENISTVSVLCFKLSIPPNRNRTARKNVHVCVDECLRCEHDLERQV